MKVNTVLEEVVIRLEPRDAGQLEDELTQLIHHVNGGTLLEQMWRSLRSRLTGAENV